MKFIFLFLFLAACTSQGEDLPNFHNVQPDVFRSGQPTALGYHQLANRGIRTVIKLNSEYLNDEQRWAAQEHITLAYLPIPLFQQLFTGPDEATMKRINHLMVIPQTGPILIHCMHGNDRTGLVIGMYRVRHNGFTAEQAYDEMLARGFHPELLGLYGYFWSHAQ